jgi:hypothetical protein
MHAQFFQLLIEAEDGADVSFVTGSPTALAASAAASASFLSIFIYISSSCVPGGLGSSGQNVAT